MELSEKQQLALARQGDSDAFEMLVQPYEERLYILCLRTMLNEQDALDMLQETLIKAWRHLNQYKGDAGLGTWLYRIAVNTCMDELRRRKRRKVVSMDHLADQGVEAAEEASFEEQAVMRQQLLSALSQLSADHRTMIVLRDIQGLPYEQLASVLGCPMGTVRSRLNRARNAMAALLRRDDIVG